MVAVASSAAGGGWTVTATGAVSAFGGASGYGSLAGVRLNRPIVGMSATPSGRGYWLVASDGGIFAFGDAGFYGSTGNIALHQPVVTMAATPDGRGYWLAASDGGIFTFGDASYYGSTGNVRLTQPVVGMAAAPDGAGYYMVAADGGIFTFGDAHFQGSMGATHLNAPITAMATSPSGGYWLVAKDGGLFSFGAPFYGTASGAQLAGMVPLANGTGYDEVDSAGGVHAFAAPSNQASTPASNPAAGQSSTPAAGESTSGLTLAQGTFASSFFDQPVTTRPVAANSAAIVANLVSQYQTYYGSVGVNQMPVFNVPATEPLVPVSVRPGCNNFTASTGTAIPIPPNAYTTDPNYQHDSDIIIQQPSTHSVWELWKAVNNGNGTWSACWGGKLDPTTSSGVFPFPWGLAASGISYMATMITEADVQSGSINHAIAMQVVRCDHHTAPSTRGDCNSDPGEPAEGTWLRMPAGVAMPAGLTPFAQMVFHALQTYGMVVVDQAGAVMLQAESAQDWTTTGHSGADPMVASWGGKPQYATLGNIPWGSLDVIQPPSQ